MLQSYGVQAGIYLKTEVKNEIHIPGLKRVIRTFKSWFPLLGTQYASELQLTYRVCNIYCQPREVLYFKDNMHSICLNT